MLNQTVLVGRVSNIRAYNDNTWVTFEITCDDNKPIPIYIEKPQMASSLVALVKEGSLIGIKGELEFTYQDSVQANALKFNVMKFAHYPETEG
jgi:hypothetical protein